MKMKLISSNLAALLVAVGVVWSPEPGVASQTPDLGSTNVLTLDNAVALALTNNPGVAAFDARVDAASGRAHQASRWSNPALELGVEEWPVSGGGRFSDSKQTIGVVQELPFPGKKSLDRQLGGAGIRFSEGVLALRQTELVRDVKTSFYRVLAAQQAVEVSAQLLTVAESSSATAGKRVDAGAAAYQEQLRAEVQLEHARTELRDLERDVVNARQLLLMILGRPDLDDVVLSGTLAAETETTLLIDQPDRFLAAHPSAAAAQANLDHAQLEYRRAKLEPYPDVSVGVAGGRLGETDQSIIELGLSIPLPILDTGKGRKQETFANVRAAEADLHAVMQDLHREWTSALERYRSAIEQVDRYRDSILPKAGEAMRLVQTGFEEGKFSFIDLLDTQRTAADSQLSYRQKLLEMNVAQAELEALLRSQPIESSTTTQKEQ